MKKEIEKLTEILRESNNIVFFGGAGVSTESGIPDFRSSNGLYNEKLNLNFTPEQLVSHTFFMDYEEEFFQFYKTKLVYPEAKPNDAHKALAILEKMGKLKAVITQNIDGLHQDAGSQKVYELHGSVKRNYCMKCGAFYDMKFILSSHGVPLCTKCGGKVILQYTGDLSSGIKDTLVKETERYANSVGSGKFLPIPMGVTASTLDMKLSDAEFVELNKLNALQLASCFGIKPNILNDYSKSSYSNSETQQLDFYVNSLQPIFNMYQQEVTRKLLSDKEKNKNHFFEIDKEILFELDKNTQMEVLNKGVNNFMITPNEAREKLGLPWVNGGDELVGNGNYIKLSQVGTQWNNTKLKGGDKVEE